MEKFINITIDNIEKEHICCAISDKKHTKGVILKKEWLKERIKEGHVFRKLNANGKVFIEYAPLEKAWVPISGDNYLYIYCLWVSGSFKEKGYGKELIEYVIEDAKKQNKNGICILTSKKKKPYLSEKKFLEKYNFKVVDSVDEYELLSLDFNNYKPKFNENAKKMKIDNDNLTIYYSNQCPFVVNCKKEIEEYAKEKNVEILFEEVDSLEKAKNVPCIFNNWANFKNGKFISNLLLNKNLVIKMLEEYDK